MNAACFVLHYPWGGGVVIVHLLTNLQAAIAVLLGFGCKAARFSHSVNIFLQTQLHWWRWEFLFIGWAFPFQLLQFFMSKNERLFPFNFCNPQEFISVVLRLCAGFCILRQERHLLMLSRPNWGAVIEHAWISEVGEQDAGSNVCLSVVCHSWGCLFYLWD